MCRILCSLSGLEEAVTEAGRRDGFRSARLDRGLCLDYLLCLYGAHLLSCTIIVHILFQSVFILQWKVKKYHEANPNTG